MIVLQHLDLLLSILPLFGYNSGSFAALLSGIQDSREFCAALFGK
jgi:hypothetical protein